MFRTCWPFADKCGFDQWSKGKTVILQEDLSLEDTEWAPVASFSGAFKGNGHTISDVSLVGAYSPAGFFGILEEGGSIQDLTIKGVVNPGWYPEDRRRSGGHQLRHHY